MRSSLHVEETLSTLSYATRAKNIQNRPVVQYDPKEQQIASLRREIDLLRQVSSTRGAVHVSSTHGNTSEQYTSARAQCIVGGGCNVLPTPPLASPLRTLACSPQENLNSHGEGTYIPTIPHVSPSPRSPSPPRRT